jgi:major membrane immunogen (membrane-anchored lipoprotein)
MHDVHRFIPRFVMAATLAASALLTACGGSSSKDDPAPAAPTVYGKMTLADASASPDDGSFELTSVDACSHNTDSGVVNVTLSQGAGKSALTLAIKDFSGTAKTYTCKQAADNAASATSVGLKFETCMVDAKVISSNGATTLNGYSMYRDTVATDPFAYAGTCTIEVTAASPTVSGKVACAGMVQTTLTGTPHHPINLAVTKDLTADFSCTFR